QLCGSAKAGPSLLQGDAWVALPQPADEYQRSDDDHAPESSNDPIRLTAMPSGEPSAPAADHAQQDDRQIVSFIAAPGPGIHPCRGSNAALGGVMSEGKNVARARTRRCG